MRWSFYAFGISFGFAGISLIKVYGAPTRDEEGNIIHDEYSNYSIIPQYFLRFYKEALFFKKAIEEPSRELLLPDPLREPYYQPRYTLCLELTGVLVHPEWTYTSGWRFKKRPGVNFFLQQVGPLFETVIYTKENGMTAYPIVENLDPNGYVTYKLFRDATRYQDGQHMKDLGCLNRSLKRVIHIDWDDKAVQLHPHNSLKLKKWGGEMDDRALVDLAIFLRTIAESGVEDVRSVLEYYSQFEDPLEAFRENQRKLAEIELTAQEAEKAKPVPAWSAFRVRQ